MKKLSVILCLILMISMLPCPASAESDEGYYEQLSSEAFREAYALLEEGIASMAPVIHFPTDLEIWYLDMLEIARAVCLDHPEYFWFLESWFYEYDTGDGRYLVDKFTPTYYLDHERVSAGSQLLADAMIAFHEKVNEIITGIPANLDTDYEIALYLHDYLAEHVTYTLEGDHDSAYAALIHGKAACYGYSKAYQYLLSQAGVRSRIIVGDAVAEDGALLGHAWNQLWIDGECYYTDVTWDDLEVGTTHGYFLISLEDISRDHIADERFPLPDCGHSLDYYERSAGKGVGIIAEHTTGKEAAAFFRMVSVEGREAVLMGDVRFLTDSENWLDRNALELIRTLGLSQNTDMRYYIMGNVYFFILTDPYYRSVHPLAQSISLNLTEITLHGAGSQVSLIPEITPVGAAVRSPVYTSDDETVAVVSDSGMVTAVGVGNATITVSSYDGRVTAQCVVTVEPGQPHVHTLRLIPDFAPSCIQEGNASYYLCTGCYHRFVDENAAEEILDISGHSRPATGHVDLSWQPRKNSNSHHQMCSCGEVIPKTVGTHKDEDGNHVCDLCGAEMAVQTPADETGKDPQEKPQSMWFGWIGAGVLAGAVVIFLVMKRRY